MQRLDVNSHEMYSRKFLLSPYKIVQDKTRMYNYVIGYSQEVKPDRTQMPEKIVTYRISRIARSCVRTSLSGFISKAKKDAIEKEITQKEPQFLGSGVIALKAKFTDKGVENLNRHLYMRPRIYEAVKGEENTYIFHCTEVQAINYFFKFARDVEILEPKQTRRKFINRYRDAYMKYAESIATDKDDN